MTQQLKTPPRAFPTRAAGHQARYIHDLRGEGAGGGHIIECRCSTTAKRPTFDLARAHWHMRHRLQATAAAAEEPLPSSVLQMKLFAAGRA